MQSHRSLKSNNGLKTAIGIAVALCLIIALGLSWAVFGSSSSPKMKAGQTISVEIKEGSGTADIAQSLADAGAISSPTMFRLRSRMSGSDGQYKAGVYKFTSGESMGEVMSALKKGPEAVYVTVTIPEGKSVAQIGQILEKNAGINADEFVSYAQSAAPEYAKKYPILRGAYNNSLEGYLFPDTYRVAANATSREIVAMMLKRFNDVYSSLNISKARSDTYNTNQLVTIASLVEREVARASDRPLVASVIDNRLSKGMRLQFCSSVQFLLPGEEERTKVRLTNADISIDSPYNTYKNKGLPPGPIANPGKAALEAAINPATSDYLYFQVVDKKGTTKFDKTAAAFNKTKARAKATIGR